MSEPLDCDVVIVGAGIAGALVAWKQDHWASK